jgi:DNA-binding NarL/FixJ family response regulator
MIRVLLADDEVLVRGGFRAILQAHPDIEIVAEAGDGSQAVALTAEHDPDVVLMDVRMPGVDGIDATRRITALNPAPQVLILTTFELDEYVYAALSAEASGFMLKNVPPQQLAEAVRTVAGGDALLVGRPESFDR